MVLVSRTDHSADSLNAAAIDVQQGFAVHSITVDNGMKFAKFPVLEKKLNTQVYFANEHCPWERGLNENTEWTAPTVLPARN